MCESEKKLSFLPFQTPTLIFELRFVCLPVNMSSLDKSSLFCFVQSYTPLIPPLTLYFTIPNFNDPEKEGVMYIPSYS